MKRFHIHIAVDSLPESIRFYSALFNQAPSVEKADYAKWMLDDPRINLAISSRGATVGVDHLGIQVDSDGELAILRTQLDAAAIPVQSQTGAACCYAESDKHWVTDPSGIAWESYHTLNSIPTFNTAPVAAAAGSCCAPAVAVALPKPAKTSCGPASACC